MEPIFFFKMSGSGNDFIVIDNRQGAVSLEGRALSDWIVKVCARKMSAGADGLILIEDDDSVDFRWGFYNSDGSRAEMCGNGARCAARFAHVNGICGSRMRFRTDAGIISAEVDGDRVTIGMSEPSGITSNILVETGHGWVEMHHLNTGVPHAVVPVPDIEAVPVADLGREIRYHERFAPAGTNVNFSAEVADNRIAVRTYERGVEDETLACGTGAVASALVAAVLQDLPSPVEVLTRSGGILTIHFQKDDAGFCDVRLGGDARIIYRGTLTGEAWAW